MGEQGTEAELREVPITTSLHVLEPWDYKYCSAGTLFGGCSGHRVL